MDKNPRCIVCHRELKDPGSIARGIGPVCWSRANAGSNTPSSLNNRMSARPGQLHFLDRLVRESKKAGS